MSTMATERLISVSDPRVRRNLSTPVLVELALARGEGRLAANGTLVVSTGERTGRSPTDKYLEDVPEVHDHIAWGKVNQPITPAGFDEALRIAGEHYQGKRDDVFVYDALIGADRTHQLRARVYTELAWHSLFVKTLFIDPKPDELASFHPDWTILNCCKRKLTAEESKRIGIPHTGLLIAQSLTRKMVLIFGTEYAGEIKKGMFYAMNYDMVDEDVFPMHCSANVDGENDKNVALFFGLSGTGKTTLSADPARNLIGDDEHGWSPKGVFNFEGGCYAKCIRLSRDTEPQIWDAIRFGSVLENVVMDEATRAVDYDDPAITENTRVTYPVEFIPHACHPSVGGHPSNVVFLTADAFGVLPPVAKLTPEQAMYYFINGYTSKLAGTEAGVTEPKPNFSPCFGGPFMPRPAHVYASMLADRLETHGASAWLINTGWTGGPYGVGSRFPLRHTRAMVTAILDGSLAGVTYETEPHFGLHLPTSIPHADVPDKLLHPERTWGDRAAYEAKARDLAARFRENDQKYDMPQPVRDAGPPIAP
jgi:phosphoenolpyruvate carboxykinase (ATP)